MNTQSTDSKIETINSQPPHDNNINNDNTENNAPQLQQYAPYNYWTKNTAQPNGDEYSGQNNHSMEGGGEVYQQATRFDYRHHHTTPIVCRHFLHGKCAFGTRCRFLHQIDQQVVQGGEDAAGSDNTNEGTTPNGEDVDGASQNHPSSGYGTTPGPQQQRYNNYGHSGYIPAQTDYYSAGYAYAAPYYGGGYNNYYYGGTAYVDPRGRIPCRYYRQGFCRYGAECRYAHE